MHTELRKILFARRDDGASAVEYGLLVAAIAAVIVVIAFALGGLIQSTFSNTCTSIHDNLPNPSSCA